MVRIVNTQRKLYRKIHSAKAHSKDIPILNTGCDRWRTICPEPAFLEEEWEAHRGHAFRLIQCWPQERGYEGYSFAFGTWPQLITAFYLPTEATYWYITANDLLIAGNTHAPDARPIEELLEVSLSVEAPRIPFDRLINGKPYRRIEAFYPFLLSGKIIDSDLLFGSDVDHLYLEAAFLAPYCFMKWSDLCLFVYGQSDNKYRTYVYRRGVMCARNNQYWKPVYNEDEIVGWETVESLHSSFPEPAPKLPREFLGSLTLLENGMHEQKWEKRCTVQREHHAEHERTIYAAVERHLVDLGQEKVDVLDVLAQLPKFGDDIADYGAPL